MYSEEMVLNIRSSGPTFKMAGSGDGFLTTPRRSDNDPNLVIDVFERMSGGVERDESAEGVHGRGGKVDH